MNKNVEVNGLYMKSNKVTPVKKVAFIEGQELPFLYCELFKVYRAICLILDTLREQICLSKWYLLLVCYFLPCW